MTERKKQWRDFTPAQKAAIVVGAILELVLTSIALVDLRRRPSHQIRGPKPFWFLATFVQPFGPIAYLLLGRRRTSS